mmetsp:Transcript_21492/g.32661  ORF Transcript_21492/g.32661 Transcript_21492/m.32661 type:complete len:248 (-) Transcript_21492:79-822(-)
MSYSYHDLLKRYHQPSQPDTPRTFHKLTLHLILFGGFLLAFSHFVVNPGCHASTNTTESDISHNINKLHNGIIPFTFNTDIEARSANRQHLQAVVAANETDVILVQSKTVLLHNHSLGRTNCHARAATPLKTHAALRAAILPHIAGLDTATTTKHSLAALIIFPSTSWLAVIQGHVANFVLSAGEAEHGAHPAAWFCARSATQLDLEGLFIVSVLSPRVTIFALPFFRAQLVTGKAEKARHCWSMGA